MEQLKDIRAIEVINIDYSPYIITLSVLVILFLLILYYFMKKDKVVTDEQKAIKYLENLDFNSESKLLAYDFTLYGKVCVTSLYEDEFMVIVNKLEKYKYKKNMSENIDIDLINDMKDYIRVRL